MHELVDTTPAVFSTSTVKPPQRLFIPGPTDVLPEVLEAQTAPMIGHRSDEFEALFAKCEGSCSACLRPSVVSTSSSRRAPVCTKLPSATAVGGRVRLLCQWRLQPALARRGRGL